MIGNNSIFEYRCDAESLFVPLKEVLRYMGASCDNDYAVTELAKKALVDIKKESSCSVIYSPCKPSLCSFQESVLDLGFGKITSQDTANYFKNCDESVVFCATVGMGTDRLVQRYKVVSPALALAYNAAGTALVEALCDKFCQNLTETTLKNWKPRISPGYGDIPLECQPGVLEFLDAFKRQGIRLNDSLLMTPSKTVTAFAGVCNS